MKSLLIAFVAVIVLPGTASAMPSPAAVFCEEHGAKVQIETEANGAQKGICVFPDGTRIDEWAYFRNKHRTQK